MNAIAILAACLATAAADPPPPEHNLRLDAPIDTWDEAIPLGNGLMGGLLWGSDNTIRLSLDRGDLWDERTHLEPQWWKKHPWINPLFPVLRSGPTAVSGTSPRSKFLAVTESASAAASVV